MARRQRLGGENVQARSGDSTFGERIDQRGFVDNRAARGVDEDGGGLHEGQLARADEALSGGREAQVDADDITGAV